MSRQLELFPNRVAWRGMGVAKARGSERAELCGILKAAEQRRIHGLTRAEVKRLMTPLPPITVHRE